jgi:hypothetical protein
MRSSLARHGDVPSIADVAIAIAHVCTGTFFIVVIKYCSGGGELTRAGLHLRGDKTRMAHAPAATNSGDKQNRETKESKNGQWWSSHTSD